MEIRKLKNNLLEIYNDLSAGMITIEEASEKLGLLGSDLKNPADGRSIRKLPCEALCLATVYIPMCVPTDTDKHLLLSELLPKGAIAMIGNSLIFLISEGYASGKGYLYAVTTFSGGITVERGQVLRFS